MEVALDFFQVRVFKRPINSGRNRVRIFAGNPFTRSILLSGHTYRVVLIVDTKRSGEGYYNFLSTHLGIGLGRWRGRAMLWRSFPGGVRLS